ncbi:MAG: hypothetical protein LBR80_18455 [Deltaproteobacteria bacterium]|jgi:hypothetical protein|nr:hypothetical protein [Deltaproteobacteria bacterium]
MRHVPSVLKFLRHIVSAPAYAADAPESDGPPFFDSAWGFPRLTPSFTVSYPPSMRPGDVPERFRTGGSAVEILGLQAVDIDLKGYAVMDIAWLPWDREMRSSVKEIGLKCYWNYLAQDLPSEYDARLESFMHWKEKGAKGTKGVSAADIRMFHTLPLGDSPCGNEFPTTEFIAVRSFIAGKGQFIFTGFCLFPKEVAEANDYDANENPLAREYIQPVFDSIRFRV